MKKKIELLAPAGNMDSLKAAVAAGCDAIYLGLQSFSARAFAGNFSHEEFIEAISYCHIRDVKIYVTINTMLFETEIENATHEVDFLYENDVDGILVQDLGLFHYIRTCYPDLDVHCSTQMHIHNIAGVEYMKNEGAKRVVLARETPIEIIEEACKKGVEIEVFVYGAICISYSGQCLMSSVMKKRSANRGMCAQCCRLKYYPTNGKFKEGDYILSPKDLNVIDEIPSLIEAGVSSLKIEGRMKRPEYVWLITKTFREAIDAYYEGKEYHVDEKRYEELLLMFNRGFSLGHIFHSSIEERMSQYRPNHQGIEIGTVLQFRKGRVQVKLSQPLNQHDGLRILNQPVDTGLTAVKIYDEKERLVNHANPNQVVWLDCKDTPSPKPGQKLHKTSDAVLLKNIQLLEEKPVRILQIQMNYQGTIGHPFQLTITDHEHIITVQSEFVCEQSKNAPVTKEKIEANLAKLGDTPYHLEKIDGSIENIFLPMSTINETRRQAIDQLNIARAKLHQRIGKQPYAYSVQKPLHEPCKTLIKTDESHENTADQQFYKVGYGPYEITPVVDEKNNQTREYHGNILSNYCDLGGTHEDCIAGMTLNIANSYAMAYVLHIPGIVGVIVSSEVDETQLEGSIKAFEKRYGFTPYLYELTNGRRTIMYIKNGFMNHPEISSIKDLQDYRYEIVHHEGIVELLEPESLHIANPCTYGKFIIENERNGE